MPCQEKGLGWFNPSDGCYWKLANPQPPAGDPAWAGHVPGRGGAVYAYACPFMGGPSTNGGLRWLPTPPPGQPANTPPAAAIAQMALAKLMLPTMSAQSNGGASGTTYVGLPTWLWLPVEQWRSVSATAAVGTRSVTLTASPVSVTWSMGEGGSTTCAGPGEPFSSADPAHPPCGYTYRVDSIGQPQTGPSPNDRYFAVQGAVLFALHWTCAGDCDQAAGDMADMTRATTRMPLRVFQVETVLVNH